MNPQYHSESLRAAGVFHECRDLRGEDLRHRWLRIQNPADCFQFLRVRVSDPGPIQGERIVSAHAGRNRAAGLAAMAFDPTNATSSSGRKPYRNQPIIPL